MTASNLAPIRFAGVSQVTATLGSNDPQVGDRCEEGGNSYVFVYNNGTSQISPGYGATVTAATGYSCPVSTITATDWVIGVCKNATITTNTYGWLVTPRICDCHHAGDLLSCCGRLCRRRCRRPVFRRADLGEHRHGHSAAFRQVHERSQPPERRMVAYSLLHLRFNFGEDSADPVRVPALYRRPTA
jgi:hypothetical protein